MPRSRVPIRGSIGKAILTGKTAPIVQNVTVVQQTVKGTTSGVSGVASTIWPLIQQIPPNISDLAAIAATGVISYDGADMVSTAPGALTKTDDTNVTLTLGGTPATALLEAASLTLGWEGQLAVPRGGSGADSLTGYLVGNGTSPFTAVTDVPAADVSGLAAVATSGAYADLTGTPVDLSALTFLTGNDETADAPNSLRLLAGTNIAFDTSTPNQITISATGGSSSPLTTKGDIFGFDTGDARIPVGTDGDVLTADSGAALGVSWQAVSGTGTVTSVDASVPSILTISGNPITTAGTLAFDLATQTANLTFAGPASGGDAQPTFRTLVIADIPTIPAAHTSGFATVATSGAYTDLSGTPSLAAIATSGSASDLGSGTVPSARLPTASASVLGAVKVDGTTITISGGVISSTGGASGANPTAKVGPTATNGSATTFLRSDGAPALDLTAVYVLTGSLTVSPSSAIGGLTLNSGNGPTAGNPDLQINRSGSTANALAQGPNVDLNDATNSTTSILQHSGGQTELWQFNGSWAQIFKIDASHGFTVNAPSSAIALSVNGPAGNWTQHIAGSGTSGSSFGLIINAGTTSGDGGLNVSNPAGSVTHFNVRGDGVIQGGGPVAGALIDMTPDASSFTGTLTGMTATITNTCVWSRQGNQVTLVFGLATGTSNATTLTMTGLPPAIQPARTQQVGVPIGCLENAGTNIGSAIAVIGAGSGTIVFYNGAFGTGWTITGAKGISETFTVTYLLN